MSKILIHCPDDVKNLNYIAGLDEVGRGCFAGPVVTASVILPPDFKSELIRDSKKLTPRQRENAFKLICDEALAYSIEAIQAKDINVDGINLSTFKAMYKCIDSLTIKPEYLLIDGTQWTSYDNIPYVCVPKGDDTYLSIASASILAKVKRDDYMSKVGELHPEYNFGGNKGYYCKKHGEAILKYGTTSYHRDQYVNTWLKKQ